MGSAICGGMIPYSAWIKQSPDEHMATMMSKVRKRIHAGKHYRYKIIDPLGDCWHWEDESR